MQLVIGGRLWELDMMPELKIPQVLHYLFNYFDIFKHYKELEGIFRRNCGAGRLNKLKFFLTFKEYNCLGLPLTPAEINIQDLN